jgi:hypothetical protein
MLTPEMEDMMMMIIMITVSRMIESIEQIGVADGLEVRGKKVVAVVEGYPSNF